MSRKFSRIALVAASASLLYGGMVGAAITQDVDGLDPTVNTADNPQNIAAQTTDVILQNQPTTGDVVFTIAGALAVSGSTITLQVNGALFNPSAPPEVAVGQVGGGSAAAVASTTGTLSPDNTQAQWSVSADFIATDTITFQLNAVQSTDLRSVTAGTNVDYTITINAGGAAIESTPVDTELAFSIVNAATLDTTNFAANTDTADVSQSFIFLNTGTGVTTGAGAANFTVQNPTSSQALTEANLVCILRGDLNGITSVTNANVTGSSDSGSTASGVATEFLIDSSNAFAAAVITGGLAATTNADIAPVFELDGVTAQNARSFTLECDLLAGGTFGSQDNVISLVASESIARNGFGFQSVFLGTSANNQVVIRDHSGNLGSAGGNISVTLTFYDGAGAGTTIGPVTLATKLPNNGQVVLTPSQIIGEMGAVASGVPTESFATFEFAVETAAGSAGNKKQVPGIGIDIQEATNINTGLL